MGMTPGILNMYLLLVSWPESRLTWDERQVQVYLIAAVLWPSCPAKTTDTHADKGKQWKQHILECDLKINCKRKREWSEGTFCISHLLVKLYGQA